MVIEPRNPYGAVQIADGGAPRVITVLAYDNISGGYWVNGSAGPDLLNSGADSYIASDLRGTTVATQIGSTVIGLALQNIGSNTYGPCAMRGLYIMPGLSGEMVPSGLPGQQFAAGSAGTIFPLGSSLQLGSMCGGHGDSYTVGRMLTAGGHGSYAIVSLNI